MCTHTHVYYIITYYREKTNFVKKKNSSKINRFVLLPTGRFHVNRQWRQAIYTDQLFVEVFFFIQNVFLIIIHCRLR